MVATMPADVRMGPSTIWRASRGKRAPIVDSRLMAKTADTLCDYLGVLATMRRVLSSI
jgi:hypothetical protein